MLSYSIEYFISAIVIEQNWNKNFSKPLPLPETVDYLLGHSIELATKSFLLHSGCSDADLKKIGHNLVECVDHAKKHGLEIKLFHCGQVYAVNANAPNSMETRQASDKVVLSLLDQEYCKKRYEYPIAGMKNYPEFSITRSYVSRLIASICDILPEGEDVSLKYCFDRHKY